MMVGYRSNMINDNIVRTLGPAFLPHMLRRLSDLLVDGGMEWARRKPALPPLRTHSTMFALEQHGELSVTELATLLRQSHPLALQWVTALEKLGLVGRHRDPTDARRTMLRLTEEGIASMPAINYARAVNERTVRRLTEELGTDLWGVLGQLEELLDDRPYFRRVIDATNSPELKGFDECGEKA